MKFYDKISLIALTVVKGISKHFLSLSRSNKLIIKLNCRNKFK